MKKKLKNIRNILKGKALSEFDYYFENMNFSIKDALYRIEEWMDDECCQDITPYNEAGISLKKAFIETGEAVPITEERIRHIQSNSKKYWFSFKGQKYIHKRYY